MLGRLPRATLAVMSRFWLIIVLLLMVLAVSVYVNPLVPNPRYSPPSTTHWLYAHAIIGMIVAIIWAIAFRPSLEKGRVTLPALLALVAMEAVFLWLMRVVHPLD